MCLPYSLLQLKVNDDSVLLPGDISEVIESSIMDKMPPDDALEGDGRAGVVEFGQWEVLWSRVLFFTHHLYYGIW